MRVLHLLLTTAATYGLIVAVQKLDKRWLLRPEVRERAWNFATWGAAVYWLAGLSFLGWGWVTRWRFDPWLGAMFKTKARPGVLHVAIRAVLGLATGILELLVVAVLLEGVEYALVEGLGLPAFGGLGG